MTAATLITKLTGLINIFENGLIENKMSFEEQESALGELMRTLISHYKNGLISKEELGTLGARAVDNFIAWEYDSDSI